MSHLSVKTEIFNITSYAIESDTGTLLNSVFSYFARHKMSSDSRGFKLTVQGWWFCWYVPLYHVLNSELAVSKMDPDT